MKIKKIVVSNFRGISQPVELDFLSGAGNTPGSLILAGDNGTGKSSIVDAIEFALQGRVGRQKIPLYSFASEEDTKVSVSFQMRRLFREKFGL